MKLFLVTINILCVAFNASVIIYIGGWWTIANWIVGSINLAIAMIVATRPNLR